MTTAMKIALSPMTIFDGSLTVPEMFSVYTRLADEGLNMGTAITYTRPRCKFVITTIRKDGNDIVIDFYEEYNDNSRYNRTMFVTEFLNWIFD